MPTINLVQEEALLAAVPQSKAHIRLIPLSDLTRKLCPANHYDIMNFRRINQVSQDSPLRRVETLKY